ncbi:hypothetical protein JR338_03490 [Chloroflexota bacterium]|nr:hypothetical protein JR338_03490 [Chloroflexota bacterium]
MPRIHCHYLDCLFLDGKYCSAAAIEIDPDTGCKTYKPNDDVNLEDWDDQDEMDEWDEMEGEEDEELWVDDEDDDLLGLELEEDEDDF